MLVVVNEALNSSMIFSTAHQLENILKEREIEQFHIRHNVFKCCCRVNGKCLYVGEGLILWKEAVFYVKVEAILNQS